MNLTTPAPSHHPLVLAITGASGAAYAVRLLQQLGRAGVRVHVIISPSGATVLKEELGLDVERASDPVESMLRFAWPGLESRWGAPNDEDRIRYRSLMHVHHYRDFMCPVASGSFLTRGMVVCPCSGSTLSGIVHAASNNLIQRAADVHLKEHRKLILVPRETPLSVFQLENMHRAAQAGAIVLPAMPGWYHGVHTLVDLVDFVVARILDHLGIEHSLMQRWGDQSQSTVPQEARDD
jgi:4-hydroxy-3-polyprenylbenzoate decarboxylase